MSNKDLNLVVRVLNKTRTGLGGVARSLKTFSMGVGRILKNIGKVGAVAITAAIVGGLVLAKKAISSAISMDSVRAQFKVVFKDNLKDAKKWSRNFSNHYGVALKTVSALLVGTADKMDGFEGATRKMSMSAGKQLVKLSKALGQWQPGKTMEDAAAAMESAMAGQYRPLRAFGVMLNKAVVVKKAKDMFPVEAAKKMITQGHLTLAMLDLVKRKSPGAIAGLEQGLKGAEASMNRFRNSWHNLLLEGGTQFVQGFGLAEQFQKAADVLGILEDRLRNSQVVKAWGEQLNAVIEPFLEFEKSRAEGDKYGMKYWGEKKTKAFEDVGQSILDKLIAGGKEVGYIIGQGIKAGILETKMWKKVAGSVSLAAKTTKLGVSNVLDPKKYPKNLQGQAEKIGGIAKWAGMAAKEGLTTMGPFGLKAGLLMGRYVGNVGSGKTPLGDSLKSFQYNKDLTPGDNKNIDTVAILAIMSEDLKIISGNTRETKVSTAETKDNLMTF